MEAQQARKVLALLFVGVLMGALDLAIIGPALPAIQADFDMDNRQLSWLFNIYVLTQLIGTPLLAKLSDRYGRRLIYALSVGGFALGSLLLVIAPGIGFLMLARAIQGFGAGGIFPVAAAVIGDTFPPEKRGGALGLIGAVFGLAFLVGPVLGGILLRWSWHWLFLINLPIAAVLIAYAWRLLPGSGAREPKPFDAAGALTLSLALAGLAIAVTNLDSSRLLDSLRSLQVWPFLAGTAVLLPLFWRFEKRAVDPVVRPSFFDSRQIRLTVTIAMGVGTVESSSVFFPALAVAGLGVSESTAAWLMLPSVLAMTVAAPLIGRLLDRIGSRLIVQCGLVCVFIGLLMYSELPITYTVFIGGGILGGLGLAGLLGAPFRYIVLNEAHPEDRAAAQGLLTVFMAVGQLLGAAIVGAVAASRGGGVHGYQSAFLVLAVLTGLMVFLAFALKRRAAERAHAAAANDADGALADTE
ncbi:MAG: MFS transporter [Gammaproteobacteria bacterium]|nr:MAG: MFS transporter [Gammaproteobacteria bacterium]